MTQITDELLVAYVDGELSLERQAEVEQALKSNQQVREAVQVFRDTADWSRRAFDDVMHEPVPERLIRAASGTVPASDEAPVRRPSPHRVAGRGRFAAMAMAASIALAIGVGGGFGLSQLAEPLGAQAPGVLLVGAVAEDGALHLALESTASGTLTAFGNGGDVMPLATFVDHGGHYCREFQASLANANGPSAAFGIACRQPAGSWHVQAVGAVPDPGQVPSDRFVPADGSADPLQVLVGAMSDSGPITLDGEAALLAGGWK